MKSTPLLLFLLLFTAISCQQKEQKEQIKKISNDETWVKKTYYEKSGALKSEITVKNKKKNGPAKEYYPSGKLRTIVNYVDNLTVGETIWYYENGQPYRVTPYVNGKMEGIRRVYYDNGKLQAEIPYKAGTPLEGLKEYDKQGKLITKYPQIVFETKNNLKVNNKFILICKLSKHAKKVTFYQELKNSEGQEYLSPLQLINGSHQIEFYIPTQAEINKDIPIRATFETSLGNTYTLRKVYQLIISAN